MNSRSTLNKVKPFLPPKGVQLDCLKLEDGWSRMHRHLWESHYPQWAEEYGENPLIFQALDLPDEVINAAAERLFSKPIGFGMGRVGICQTHMQIIAAAIFYAPHEEIQSRIAAISECFKIVNSNVLEAEQRKQLQAIRAHLDRLEDGQTIDV